MSKIHRPKGYKRFNEANVKAELRERLPASAWSLLEANPTMLRQLVADTITERAQARIAESAGLTVDQVEALQGPNGVDVIQLGTNKGHRYRMRRWAYQAPRGTTPLAPELVMLRERVMVHERRDPRTGKPTGETYVSPLHDRYAPSIVRWEHLAPDGSWKRDLPVGTTAEGRQVGGGTVYGQHSDKVECNHACIWARGSKCTCACGGANHGIGILSLFAPSQRQSIADAIHAWAESTRRGEA